MELDREQVIKDLEWKKLASSRMGSVTVSAEQMASYYALIEELTASEDYWKRQAFDACMDKDRMDNKIKELTKENERLKTENNLLLNFMAPRDKTPGCMRIKFNLPKGFASANSPANEYIISERALGESLKKIKSDIVREFAERLKYTLCINNEENTEFFDYEYTLETIDQIAKEMVEDGYDT